MVVNAMLDKVIKGIIGKEIVKPQMSNVVFDYLIEAQFISFFNNYWIRREVKDVVRDTVDDIVIGEIIEDYVDRILLEAVPIICQGELNAEMKR